MDSNLYKFDRFNPHTKSSENQTSIHSQECPVDIRERAERMTPLIRDVA